MLEHPKLAFLSNFIKEQLETRITRLENRHLNEDKDLKLIGSEFEKLKTILKESEKIAENVYSKKASNADHTDALNKSIKNVINISNISNGPHDEKNKKLAHERNSKKVLTRNATEANILNSHRDKKVDPKDRMTPFRKKPINTEEPKINNNRTTVLEEKILPKTPKAKRPTIDGFNKINKEEKLEGNATDRTKGPSSTKALTRNKTTGNLLTSRKHKEEEEKGKDSDKTVNQSMTKNKKGENLQTIPETKALTKQPTARKIETARKEKPELTKHATEAVIKSNTKAILNKEKDSKAKENTLNANSQNKNVNSKIKGTIEESSNKEKEEDFIPLETILNKYDNKKQKKSRAITEEAPNLNKEGPPMKIDSDFKPEMNVDKGINPHNGFSDFPPEIKKKIKVNYIEKIKGEIWKDNILEFLDHKGDEKNVFKLCRKFLNLFFQKALKKLDAEISVIKTKISNLKEKYREEDLTKEAPKFVMTRGAIKAVELLNDKMYMQLFNPNQIPPTEILNIYRVLFYFINKVDIAKKKSRSEFWQDVCLVFIKDPEIKIGNFINQHANDLNFSTENIFAISQIIGNDLSKMTAPNFTKICPTTGLVFFFIKDALEYSGIIVDKKTPPIKIMNLLDYNLESLSSKIDRLKGKLEKQENSTVSA